MWLELLGLDLACIFGQQRSVWFKIWHLKWIEFILVNYFARGYRNEALYIYTFLRTKYTVASVWRFGGQTKNTLAQIEHSKLETHRAENFGIKLLTFRQKDGKCPKTFKCQCVYIIIKNRHKLVELTYTVEYRRMAVVSIGLRDRGVQDSWISSEFMIHTPEGRDGLIIQRNCRDESAAKWL